MDRAFQRLRLPDFEPDGLNLTPQQMLYGQILLLERILDAVTPGTLGVEGAQEIPEILIERFPIATNAVYPLLGNRLYKSRLLRNAGTGDIRVFTAAPDLGDQEQYFTIANGGALQVQARSTLYLVASGSAATLEVFNEAS